MATAARLATRADEKLITEYPFREGLAVYLDAWKQLLSISLKSIAIAGVGVLIVVVASMFLTGAAVLAVASSIVTFFTSLIVDHPIFSLLALVGVVIGLIALRGRAASH
jgi:hypothetical protein